MLKTCIYTIIIMGMLPSLAYANTAQSVCTDNKTELRCETGEVNNIKYIGDVLLSGTHVKQATYTLGNFEALNADLFKLYRAGDSYLQHTKIRDKFTHKGNVTSVSSEFGGPNDIVGNVVANHSHFVGTTLIAGSFIGDSNQFEDPVRVTGSFRGNQNVFHSKTEIIGTLQAKATQFYDQLHLTMVVSALSNSQTNDIFVSKFFSSCCLYQTLYLTNNTQVKGNITFSSGKGLVILSGGSKIAGRVVGGKVINREVNSI